MTAESIFGTTGHVGVTQECARALLVFFYGLLLVRLFGRRVFARWSALDIVVAIVVGSNLSRALTGNADLLGTLAATTLLMVLHWLLARAAAVWTPLSWLVEGRPVHLADGGTPRRAVLVRHGISATALDEALRGAGVESAAHASSIVLEPNGRVSVLKRD